MAPSLLRIRALEKGDLGWRKGGEIPSLFADAVSAMKVGENSGIITSPSGYHIVKLADKRSGEKILEAIQMAWIDEAD